MHVLLEPCWPMRKYIVSLRLQFNVCALKFLALRALTIPITLEHANSIIASEARQPRRDPYMLNLTPSFKVYMGSVVYALINLPSWLSLG